MTLKRTLRESWRRARVAAVLVPLLGIVLLLLGGSERSMLLERWSYDFPYLLRPEVKITNVAIIYMDEASHTLLQQPYDGSWDRLHHAKLVRSLTQFGTKAIAFDIFLGGASTNASADQALADAMRAHGNVVLGADLGTGDYYGRAAEIKTLLPYTNFLAATPHWGLVQLFIDEDVVVRRHFHGFDDIPGLSWKTAHILGAPATTVTNSQRLKRWLNYYGPHGTIPIVSYHKVIDDSDPALAAFFRNRTVFIGSATQSGFSGKRRDQFGSPYAGAAEPFWPGVDFHATQFLNLMRNDWLRPPPWWAELGVIALCGIVAAVGLALLRPVTAVWTALGMAVVVTVAGCLVIWLTDVWFAWMIIVAVQIPAALACSVVQVAQKKSIASDADLTAEFPRAPAVASAAVQDYEMLYQIGSGNYGQVWLARSVTGVFRAVKIVDWKSPNDSRFEREFAGLKSFEPISRAHDGLVAILHVGRNDAARHLYYVMELADSCGSNPQEDPAGYVPATLKTKLTDVALEPNESLQISLKLTSALAFLHEQGLLHRDIKPSNIIFIAGQPKLADIGLVAEADETLSFVGTVGYIPPEGPGSAAADVYSLGKVLSELIARTNRDVASSRELDALSQIIDRACAPNLADRFKTATEMLQALRSAIPWSNADPRQQTV